MRKERRPRPGEDYETATPPPPPPDEVLEELPEVSDEPLVTDPLVPGALPTDNGSAPAPEPSQEPPPADSPPPRPPGAS